tara:strand:- start:27553 stop:28506 length:954 start_codon:yes stop_codon:yes gene_type:complete
LIFFKNSIFLIIFLYSFNVLSEPLVNSYWLEDKICKEGFIVLEVYRSKKNYELAHIPCSVYTNFYESGWRENKNNIPLLLPKKDQLVKVIEEHGISNFDHVIISAPGTGLYDAAETTAIYFTFKYLGHEKISILDGGFKDWTKEWDRDLETGSKKVKRGKFVAKLNNNILAYKADVKELLSKTGYLVDARPSDMYLGINMDFPAIRNGTLPNAINIPNAWMLRNKTLYFQSIEKLKNIYNFSGVNYKEGIVSFCNAGLESALSWFVMSELLNYPNNKLYESSIAEWSLEESLPMLSRFKKIEVNISEGDGFSMKPDN